MADDEGRAPVGSVAEEAARLLDALGGWAERSGYGAPVADEGPTPSPAPPTSHGTHEERDHACSQCGAQTGVGRAVTCQVCPLCQGIALLRSVRPETVDRLADLAAAVSATLRDVAGERRRDAGPAASTQPRPSRVQDIRIDDEGSTGGAEA